MLFVNRRGKGAMRWENVDSASVSPLELAGCFCFQPHLEVRGRKLLLPLPFGPVEVARPLSGFLSLLLWYSFRLVSTSFESFSLDVQCRCMCLSFAETSSGIPWHINFFLGGRCMSYFTSLIQEFPEVFTPRHSGNWYLCSRWGYFGSWVAVQWLQASVSPVLAQLPWGLRHQQGRCL